MGKNSQQQPSPKIEITVEDSGRLIFRLGLISLVCYLIFHIDFLAISASLLLAASLSSRILASHSLRGLQLRINTKQQRTHSGDPIQATLSLANNNRFLPVFYPIISIREQESLRIQVFQHKGLIPAKSMLDVAISPSLASRGLRQLEAFAPRTRFPFALHQANANCQALSPQIIVWPKSTELDVDSLLNDPPNPQLQALGEQSLHALENEPSRIRDYQPGDPKPRINWKLSAKLDKLTIIEPRFEQLERYQLYLDSSTKLWPSAFAFERMLALVTSLVSELSRRHLLQGITIDRHLFPITNHQELTRFFDAIALLQPNKTTTKELPPFLQNHLQILPAPDSGITLVSHSKKPKTATSR